jgi:hypothetical protein
MNISNLSKSDKSAFMNEEEITDALNVMELDDSLNTKPVYIRDSPTPVGLLTFRENHVAYLKGHPKINPANYLANLRIMIKKRS